MKVKTYVITVSQFFPTDHQKKGQPTGFVSSIGHKVKIHTIRQNFKLWEKRIEQVMEGNAVLSLRFWSGKPYQSKQVEFFRLTKSDGVGIEKFQMTTEGFLINNVDHKIKFENLAKNDGLTFEDFKDWFKKVKPNSEPMAIIHFTNYRYSNEIDVIDPEIIKHQ